MGKNLRLNHQSLILFRGHDNVNYYYYISYSPILIQHVRLHMKYYPGKSQILLINTFVFVID